MENPFLPAQNWLNSKGETACVLWFRGEGQFSLNGVSNTYRSRSCLLQEVLNGATTIRFIAEGNSLHSEGYRRAEEALPHPPAGVLVAMFATTCNVDGVTVWDVS